MFLFALALVLLSPAENLPEEWRGVADLSPENLAESARRRCAPTVFNCADHFRQQQETLATAWGSEFTTVQDKLIMLKAIEDNTDAGVTDWHGARVNYFGRRRLQMVADGRSIKLLPAPKVKKRPSWWTVTTRCYAYVSRSGRSIYSGCTSY